LRTAGLLLLALALGFYGSMLTNEFARDLFLSRIIVEGSVERFDVRSGPRRIAVHRYVFVSGRRYEVTYDVFTRLRPGVAIRAEIGAGSGTLLRWSTQASSPLSGRDLEINLKTAKVRELAVPQTLLVRADGVMEYRYLWSKTKSGSCE
jgi:hypothetical protein